MYQISIFFFFVWFFSQSEGSGEDLVQLIQNGFAVINRLLLLRPSDQTVSPVEVALSSQPAGYQNQHIVGVIAEYIYHRTNPLLPKLATLFLKRLAVVLPMSILACLGNQAEPIRDVYLMRLQLTTEVHGPFLTSTAWPKLAYNDRQIQQVWQILCQAARDKLNSFSGQIKCFLSCSEKCTMLNPSPAEPGYTLLLQTV